MDLNFLFGIYLLPYVFFKTTTEAVEKPSKLEKINLESVNSHHRQLSVIQSRDVQNETTSARLAALGDDSVFRDDEVGTVFRPDLYIEDFYFRESAKPHHGLTKLVAGFSAPGTLISATNRSVEHFYARAAKNLKRALPDLQILVLRGGYRYFPLKAPIEAFGNELRRLRKAMDTLVAVLKANNLKEVQFDLLKLEFVHEKTALRPLQSLLLLSIMELFDARKLELTEKHTMQCNYFLNGHVSQLKIVLTPLQKEGYSREIDADVF